jgi:hypothetical protein
MGEKFAEFMQKPAKAQDHAPLFVSLYIVLLAFFIMLNTITTFTPEKSDNVIDAVNRRFSFDKNQQMRDTSPITDQSGDALKAFSDAVKAHSAQFLALDMPELRTSGKRIELRLPYELMFQNAQLTSTAKTFLHAVADTSLSWREGFAVSASFLQERPMLSALEYYQQRSNISATTTLHVLQQFMATTSLPSERFAIGYTHGEGNALVLRFDVYALAGGTP